LYEAFRNNYVGGELLADISTGGSAVMQRSAKVVTLPNAVD